MKQNITTEIGCPDYFNDEDFKDIDDLITDLENLKEDQITHVQFNQESSSTGTYLRGFNIRIETDQEELIRYSIEDEKLLDSRILKEKEDRQLYEDLKRRFESTTQNPTPTEDWSQRN
jgi:hypothetical protein